jgi:DNA ligase (NAD+)
MNVMTQPESMTDDELLAFLEQENTLYRANGESHVPDEIYDRFKREFARRNPTHPFNTRVEPEPDFGIGKVRHTHPMLSTDKCYTNDELAAWIRRIERKAKEINLDPSTIDVEVTVKLDGIAGRYAGGVLTTRGDGLTGNDISYMPDRGMVMLGEGDGEMVIEQAYFEHNLDGVFSHPRGAVNGAIGADNVRKETVEALQDGVIRFVSYATLNRMLVPLHELIDRLPAVREMLLSESEYAYDGLILRLINEQLKAAMGSTEHHHNWMMASKQIGETATSTIQSVTLQVGRTGQITPVLNIAPVKLSGAMIQNVTGHNMRTLIEKQLGLGAEIEISRAGEVIPRLLNVIKPADHVVVPATCPCCDFTLVWDDNNVNLMCMNHTCSAKAAARIEHYFKTLGTVDLFGPKACQKLVAADLTDINALYDMTVSDFESIGFGPGQSDNMVEQLSQSTGRAIEDFRLLAAIGIPHLGRGDSKKLLKNMSIDALLSPEFTQDRIMSIKGFGQITSKAIVEGIHANIDLLRALIERYAPVIVHSMETSSAASVSSPVSGKHIVFTGTFYKGKRDDMKQQAESLGATVQSSVNKKTDFLIAGDKVGAKKTDAAKQLGVSVLSEDQYLELISG